MFYHYFPGGNVVLSTFKLGALLGLSCLWCNGQTAVDLLSQADRLAEQGNWFAAGPLYGRAEGLFHTQHDNRHELYARLGRLHRDAESGSYSRVRSEVTKCFSDPEVKSDPQLTIRAFALLGTIDLNLNTAAAQKDWKQVLASAEAAQDAKWENRAQAELGIVAGVNGNIGAAASILFTSLSRAEKLGDTPGYVHIVTWLANGMTVHGMADKALSMIARASELAKSNGFTEIPLQLSIAKIRALTLLPEGQQPRGKDEAKALIPELLAQASAPAYWALKQSF